jgi:hypothetical protein
MLIHASIIRGVHRLVKRNSLARAGGKTCTGSSVWEVALRLLQNGKSINGHARLQSIAPSVAYQPRFIATYTATIKPMLASDMIIGLPTK